MLPMRALWVVAVLVVWMAPERGSAWSAEPNAATGPSAAPIRPIAVIRGMPLIDAARGEHVRIRGVVTFLAREHIPKEAVIVQDATGGIWVSLERLGGAFRVETTQTQGTTIHVTVRLRDYDHQLEEGADTITAAEEVPAQGPP